MLDFCAIFVGKINFILSFRRVKMDNIVKNESRRDFLKLVVQLLVVLP